MNAVASYTTAVVGTENFTRSDKENETVFIIEASLLDHILAPGWSGDKVELVSQWTRKHITLDFDYKKTDDGETVLWQYRYSFLGCGDDKPIKVVIFND